MTDMSPTVLIIAADFVFSAGVFAGLYFLGKEFIERQLEVLQTEMIAIARHGDLVRAEVAALRDAQLEDTEKLLKYMEAVFQKLSDENADLMAHVFNAQREMEQKVVESTEAVRGQTSELRQMVQQLRDYSQEIINARLQQKNNDLVPREKCDVCQRIVWQFHRHGESIICNDCWGKRRRV